MECSKVKGSKRESDKGKERIVIVNECCGIGWRDNKGEWSNRESCNVEYNKGKGGGVKVKSNKEECCNGGNIIKGREGEW